MSPRLAHIKDIRASTRDIVEKLTATEEYVQDLGKEAEYLQDRVDELEGQLHDSGQQNDAMCDQIFDLDERVEYLERQLKEATATS